MNEQDRETIQLQRLVEADHPHPTGPDLDTLLAAGHRRLRRRRAVTGAAAVAVVAAIAVPAYVASGGTGERASDRLGVATSSPSSQQPSTSGTPGCGVLLCADDTDAMPEKGKVVGEPWVLSEPADGVEEVVYTARTQGVDLATGEPGEVDVLMLGTRNDGKLHRSAAVLQPGSDGVSPEGNTTSLWSNGGRLGEKDSDVFFVVGYVEGTPDEITWSTPDGDQGAVDGMDTSTTPGYTVFYLTVPKPEGTGGDEPEPKPVEKDGKKYLEIGGDDSFRPDITFHSSDGWSCSLTDCGSVG
jgi:hypothetical protein